MILTNAAAKRDFYLIRHFGVKMSPALRHTQRQDILDVKIVMSSCPASSRSHQVVVLQWLGQGDCKGRGTIILNPKCCLLTHVTKVITLLAH